MLDVIWLNLAWNASKLFLPLLKLEENRTCEGVPVGIFHLNKPTNVVWMKR
jgi:hypothetical protein